MRQRSEAFRKGICQDKQQHRHGKKYRPGIVFQKEEGCGSDKAGTTQQREKPDRLGAQPAAGNMPNRRAGIEGVDVAIRQTVECHGRAAGEDHAEQDAEKFDPRKVVFIVPGEDGAEECKWQSEERVTEADHLQESSHRLHGALFPKPQDKPAARCALRFQSLRRQTGGIARQQELVGCRSWESHQTAVNILLSSFTLAISPVRTSVSILAAIFAPIPGSFFKAFRPARVTMSSTDWSRP